MVRETLLAHAHTITFQGKRLVICADVPLGKASLESLVDVLQESKASTAPALAGRAHSLRITLPETGPLFIRQYRRGGVWGQLLHDRFLFGHAETRAFEEVAVLKYALAQKIAVPIPKGVAYLPGLWSRAWLLMEEVKEGEPFLTRYARDTEIGMGTLQEIILEVKRLIVAKIFHPDLHPGNVVCSGDGVVVVDFDRARVVKYSHADLRARYVERWQRAVTKHQLPAILATEFEKGLYA
jgi:3-deoxy-D-manno-octulosonic acid kinase